MTPPLSWNEFYHVPFLHPSKVKVALKHFGGELLAWTIHALMKPRILRKAGMAFVGLDGWLDPGPKKRDLASVYKKIIAVVLIHLGLQVNAMKHQTHICVYKLHKCNTSSKKDFKDFPSSPVVKTLLPMQGARILSLIGEDYTCLVSHRPSKNHELCYWTLWG